MIASCRQSLRGVREVGLEVAKCWPVMRRRLAVESLVELALYRCISADKTKKPCHNAVTQQILRRHNAAKLESSSRD
jgi:hypothetical protein